MKSIYISIWLQVYEEHLDYFKVLISVIRTKPGSLIHQTVDKYDRSYHIRTDIIMRPVNSSEAEKIMESFKEFLKEVEIAEGYNFVKVEKITFEYGRAYFITSFY